MGQPDNATKPRKLGGDEGLFTVPDDFDEMDDDEIAMWEEAGVFSAEEAEAERSARRLRMNTQVTVHEAKTNLSKLLVRVEMGEEIVIARGSKPIAKLVRIESAKKPRKLGGYEGLVWMADDFDDWDDEIELIAQGGLDFDKKWHPWPMSNVAEERAEYDQQAERSDRSGQGHEEQQ